MPSSLLQVVKQIVPHLAQAVQAKLVCRLLRDFYVCSGRAFRPFEIVRGFLGVNTNLKCSGLVIAVLKQKSLFMIRSVR